MTEIDRHNEPMLEGGRYDTSRASFDEGFKKKIQGADLTKEDIQAQRISFGVGMIPSRSSLTREDIEKAIERHYG